VGIAERLTSFFTAIFLVLEGQIEDHGLFGEISTSVPEPPSWALMLAGFAAIGFMVYREEARHGHASSLESRLLQAEVVGAQGRILRTKQRCSRFRAITQ
jgi:hypothetical protein